VPGPDVVAFQASAVPSPLEPSSAVLGVESSVTGRWWSLSPVDERLAAALAQRLALPEIVARVLASRGIGPSEAPSFLDPRLRDLLPDPCRLRDMRVGATRLAAAITSGETVCVFGDYDVDGATSAALLLRFLAATGAASPRLYVPDRLREGYGPNGPALRRLAESGVSLVITVDCGIAAYDALAEAADAGLDVIVVDHHLAPVRLPPACAVINPKRLDEDGTLAHLAAVGVTFLLTVDTNRLLRQRGWYADRPEPDLRSWLDVVALGTVCDMVPLTGVNRAFVAQGLKVLRKRCNAGLRALSDLAGLTAAPGARDLGFVFGPRINAGGRVGEADLGARLLSTDDPATAAALAGRLEGFNRERQAIEQSVLDEALAMLPPAVGRADAGLLWAVGEGWHPGVVGIVASRLVERFQRPAVVVGLDGGHAIASARSLPGRDLGAAVNAAVAAGLLLKGGGHAMAAGFTAEACRLDTVFDFLSERLQADAASACRARALPVDGVLSVSGATALSPDALAMLSPFGAGHPEPRFILASTRVLSARPTGDGHHMQCIVADEAGGRLPAIAFRCTGQPLGQLLGDRMGLTLHLAGRLQARRGGGALQFILDDAAQATAGASQTGAASKALL